MDIVAYQYTIQKMVYLGLMSPYTLVISLFHSPRQGLYIPGMTELHCKTLSQKKCCIG